MAVKRGCYAIHNLHKLLAVVNVVDVKGHIIIRIDVSHQHP